MQDMQVINKELTNNTNAISHLKLNVNLQLPRKRK
jgi:hypothetical protein